MSATAIAAERRRQPRVRKPLSLEVRKKGFLFLAGEKGSGEMVDLSRTGARVNTQMDLFRNEDVILLVPQRSAGSSAKLPGRVVWTKRTTSSGKRWLQAGIEFADMDGEVRVALARLL